MATAAILNFGKSGILGYSSPYMVSVYQHIKFEANISINDRDMAKNPKSKANNRRTIKLADFVRQFYRTTKNRPIFVCHTTDFIPRFYRPILLVINLAVELGSNFADKIGRENRPILSFICHR